MMLLHPESGRPGPQEPDVAPTPWRWRGFLADRAVVADADDNSLFVIPWRRNVSRPLADRDAADEEREGVRW